MIKWKRNYQYFYDLTRQRTGTNNFSPRMFWETIEIFCTDHNCSYTQHGNQTVTCSDEDFIMIMLRCPEAVEKIYD